MPQGGSGCACKWDIVPIRRLFIHSQAVLRWWWMGFATKPDMGLDTTILGLNRVRVKRQQTIWIWTQTHAPLTFPLRNSVYSLQNRSTANLLNALAYDVSRSSIIVTSSWPCWRLTSPASRLFAQSFADQRKYQRVASLAFLRGIQ